MKEGKRGQVTLFIILAIIIVAVISSYFLYVKPTYFSKQGARIGFDGCIQDELEESILHLEKNGGFISPEFFYSDKGEEISYLCYTNQYYTPCKVQVPFLSSKIGKNLKTMMRGKVESCYKDSINELKARGYEVTPGNIEYDIFLESGRVRMEISAPTVVESQSFVKFGVELESPVDDMAMIATALVQSEAIYGDTDINTMSIYYPEYMITKNKMSDGTTIYTIESKIFEDKLIFASRSIAWPAGYNI